MFADLISHLCDLIVHLCAYPCVSLNDLPCADLNAHPSVALFADHVFLLCVKFDDLLYVNLVVLACANRVDLLYVKFDGLHHANLCATFVAHLIFLLCVVLCVNPFFLTTATTWVDAKAIVNVAFAVASGATIVVGAVASVVLVVISFVAPVPTAFSFYQPQFACVICLVILSPLDAKYHTQAHLQKCSSGLYGREGRSLVLRSTRGSPVAHAPQIRSTPLYHEHICKAK